jgi:hypothetical protein
MTIDPLPNELHRFENEGGRPAEYPNIHYGALGPQSPQYPVLSTQPSAQLSVWQRLKAWFTNLKGTLWTNRR